MSAVLRQLPHPRRQLLLHIEMRLRVGTVQKQCLLWAILGNRWSYADICGACAIDEQMNPSFTLTNSEVFFVD